MLILDTEVYSNYFLLSFLNTETGNVRHFEKHEGQAFDTLRVSALMERHTTVSFNGNNFDLPLIALALQGASCAALKRFCDQVIEGNTPTWRLCREQDIEVPKAWDHIDLMDVAPGRVSLKIYGGRLDCLTMQDLPIEPSATISPDDRANLRDYCENDLRTTAELLAKLLPAIKLREAMSKQYGMDLRSKSDAQIAQTVLTSELTKITGKVYRPQQLSEDFGFRYRDPGIIRFETDALRQMFKRVLSERFTLGGSGSVVLPKMLRENKIQIGNGVYQMGIGGLHSCEAKQYVAAAPGWSIVDWDVASYYPNIILQQRMTPADMGRDFLRVYQSIVSRRLAAKQAGDTVTADTLKIVVNASFGMLGSKYSPLYAPELLVQTTVTGQLALLMLIERLDAAGVVVLSANTDGIVLHYPDSLAGAVDEITWGWMMDTSFELESTPYRAIASRDVNNYVAVKLDGSCKGKGLFAGSGLAKNPDARIVAKAVAEHIAGGRHYATTILESRNICDFVTVRRVQGGAVWRGKFLGKAVRFYLSRSVPSSECIHYKTNSNRVPKSAGAMPLMTVPVVFPHDVDHAAYITEAEKLLCEVGYA